MIKDGISHIFQIAPPGMDNVYTMMCGACSNEHAFKAAFMAYRVSIVMTGVYWSWSS